MEIKSYLHHILPPLSIRVVVVSVVKISISLLQVDAAWATSLVDLAANPPDLAVCAVVAAHVDQAEDGEGDWNGDQDVVNNGSDVQAGFFLSGSRFFDDGSRFQVCIKVLRIISINGYQTTIN